MKSAKKQVTMEGAPARGLRGRHRLIPLAPTGSELMANRKQNHVWWTVAVILIIWWLPGLMGGHTVGGVIRILLSLALVAVLFRIIQRRRPA